MRNRWVLGLMLATASFAPLAHAESFRAEDPEAKKDYLDRISKGETAFMAKDNAAAKAGFQDAIRADGTRALGYYRLGELQMIEGKFDESLSSLAQALGKKANNSLKAKIMFLTGLVDERAHKLPEAREAFAKYVDFTQSNADAHGRPQIASQHIKVIERRIKDEIDYGKVKERIAARQKENEAKAIENARQDKNNK